MSRLSEPIYAASSAHRIACEARELLRWPLETRRDYLADVRRLRGADAADALRQAVITEHAAQKSARPQPDRRSPP